LPTQSSRIDQALTLAVLAMLIVGCFVVLQPFLTALVWAAILCTTTWPFYLSLQTRLRGRDALAALAMVLLLALAMLAPFIVVGATIADNAALVAQWGREFFASGLPAAPAWVARMPMIGATVAAYWNSTAHDTARLLGVLGDYIEPLRRLAVTSGASVVGIVLQLALSIFIAWFMFRDGHALVGRLRAAAERIAGDRGVHLASVAAMTVRGVVLGILGTALVQGVVAAIGFWIAGMQAAPLLGLLTFIVSPVPIGPPLVWAPAGLWLIHTGETGWGLFVLLWGALVVSTIDNILKPLIISRGADLPFVLVLLGVLGGAIAFGFIGVFLGPVLLAVGYALLVEWAAARATIELVRPGPPESRRGDSRSPIDIVSADARVEALRERE
jgi:predicted PurR-regulated permease PerM